MKIKHGWKIKWKINNMACVQLNKWTNETNINDNPANGYRNSL